MIISIIVAVDENNLIGSNNQLPWHLPADLKRFKTITMGHPIIMGRKTYESIGKPLPGRANIVITRQGNFKADGCIVVKSIEEAIQAAKGDSEIFITGGSQIFDGALKFVNKIYLTVIHHSFEGDAHFPAINEKEWRVTSRENHQPDEKNKYAYSYVNYERITKPL